MFMYHIKVAARGRCCIDADDVAHTNIDADGVAVTNIDADSGVNAYSEVITIDDPNADDANADADNIS